MKQLFPPGAFSDFGPCSLDPAAPRPGCHQVHGRRAGELRGQARLLCPKCPGVYGMLDQHGELIYVGKAKLLRTRVLSYFRVKSRDRRARRIIGQAKSLLWEACPSEFAALLRELELIRRWRPRWNVQGQPLRRRNTFVCLGRRPAPHVFLAAMPPKTALATFGPIPAGLRAQSAAARVNDLFRLRDCPQKQEMIFPEQGSLYPDERPPGCLRMELGACLGPCTGTCSRRSYQTQAAAARRFLSGEDRAPLQEMEQAMLAASEGLQFERAAVLRDKLDVLQWLTKRLDRLRDAREKMSFVYPVKCKKGVATWYVIEGGRPIRSFAEPTTAEAARCALDTLQSVFRTPGTSLLDSYEHIDGMLLVTAWFRKHPAELRKTLVPDEAIRRCAKVGKAS